MKPMKKFASVAPAFKHHGMLVVRKLVKARIAQNEARR